MNNDDEIAASKRMHVGRYQGDFFFFFESAVVVEEGDVQGASLCAEGTKCPTFWFLASCIPFVLA